ncbi:MAG: hypothetical protein MI702_05195, partial [Chlorobiales bacterium]|nr:hypothetical protein [Chlorobiales bacterium]
MDMRRFLFIRALEETAEQRDVKSKAADAFLAAEADRAEADLVRIAVKRSEYVEKDLSRRWGIPLQKIYSRRFSVSAGMVLVVIVISLLLGLSSNYFGGDNINLLINPFLLLLAWNVLVYVLLVVRTLISSTFDIPFAATGRSWIVNAVSALNNLITSFFGKY